MNVIKRIISHTKTVIRHKKEVRKICFKFGLYWQGLVHDLSKFSPSEFIPSIKYYQGIRSPIEAEKEDKGYSMAWLHHKSINKHHFWYWVDYNSKQVQSPVRIPIKYVYELFADTVAAGIVYSKNAGKEWKQSDPYTYYRMHNRDAANGIEFMDSATKALLDTMYVEMMEYGLDFVVTSVRMQRYKKFYNSNNWHKEYEELLNRYYK